MKVRMYNERGIPIVFTVSPEDRFCFDHGFYSEDSCEFCTAEELERDEEEEE